MAEPKLVLVEWLDHSSSAPSGWQDLDDYSKEAWPLRCCSVGWLVHEDKQVMVVVPHVYLPREGYNRKGCGDMTIVKKAIVRIKVLRK